VIRAVLLVALLAAPARMWLTGFELSDLGPELAKLGVPVGPDPHPEQHFFQRSDNYALALRGVVAQTFSSYGLHGDYHHVSDEADTLDYPHLEACARGALDAARAISSGGLRPRWLEGKDPSKPAPKEGAPPKRKNGAGG